MCMIVGVFYRCVLQAQQYADVIRVSFHSTIRSKIILFHKNDAYKNVYITGHLCPPLTKDLTPQSFNASSNSLASITLIIGYFFRWLWMHPSCTWLQSMPDQETHPFPIVSVMFQLHYLRWGGHCLDWSHVELTPWEILPQCWHREQIIHHQVCVRWWWWWWWGGGGGGGGGITWWNTADSLYRCLIQDCGISIADALEIPQSGLQSSICASLSVFNIHLIVITVKILSGMSSRNVIRNFVISNIMPPPS